jgi:hypothetical protein
VFERGELALIILTGIVAICVVILIVVAVLVVHT